MPRVNPAKPILVVMLTLMAGCSREEPVPARPPEPPPLPPAPQAAIPVPLTRSTYTNDPAAFHGILWGTPVAMVSGLQEVPATAASEGEGDWKCYTRKFDDLKFGDATLEDIRYYFRNGRPHGVILRTVPGQFENLKRTLTERHGTGTTKPGFADQLWWGFSREDVTNERQATIHLSKSFEETGYAEITAVTEAGASPYDRIKAGQSASVVPAR
jgi:hypothetical protein